jgi:superoxide dismutase, Fe-Mn family
MFDQMSRREMLVKTVPAAAAVGAMAGCSSLLAQEQAQPRLVPPDQAQQGVVSRLLSQGYGDNQYRLPELPYGYDALEPHIDAQTMELHHSRHHQTYVDRLNESLETVRQIQSDQSMDTQKLSGVQRDISFNGGGHVLHTILWATIAPDAGGRPEGEIAQAIERDFGNYVAFRNYFSHVAMGVKGSGWGLLAYEPVGDRLAVYQFGDQDLRMIPGSRPLMGIDVWEHAYYLKYQNRRNEYIEAFWNVVNWPAVNEAYQEMRRMHGRS